MLQTPAAVGPRRLDDVAFQLDAVNDATDGEERLPFAGGIDCTRVWSQAGAACGPRCPGRRQWRRRPRHRSAAGPSSSSASSCATGRWAWRDCGERQWVADQHWHGQQRRKGVGGLATTHDEEWGRAESRSVNGEGFSVARVGLKSMAGPRSGARISAR